MNIFYDIDSPSFNANEADKNGVYFLRDPLNSNISLKGTYSMDTKVVYLDGTILYHEDIFVVRELDDPILVPASKNNIIIYEKLGDFK